MKPLLVSFNLCPFVQRAAIVLAEKEVSYDVEYIDLADPPKWFIEISPLRKVPVLKVGEDVIFESSVICEFIDEAYGESLHPEDLVLKAKNRSWIEFGGACTFNGHMLAVATDEDDYRARRTTFIDNIDRLEEQISGGRYFNGDEFSLVDACFAPLFQRISYLEGMGVEIFNPDRHPRTIRWRHSLLERPSVRESELEDQRRLYVELINSKSGYFAEEAA